MAPSRSAMAPAAAPGLAGTMTENTDRHLTETTTGPLPGPADNPAAHSPAHHAPGPRTTLVTGGTGKTGRRIAERLTGRGLPVRVGSRSGEVPFDWQDPDTWDAALAGVGAVYLAYYPDITAPDAAETLGAFAGRAKAAGANRLVLLSARGADAADPAEQAVRQAGLPWTVLRATWFAQNFSEEFLHPEVMGGAFTLPTTEALREPFLDLDDLADVAVAALTADDHAGRVYELTGPEALTFAEAAAELSRVTGRGIRFQPCSAAEYAALAASEGGMPAELAEMLAGLFAQVLDGRNTPVTDDTQRVLGRRPGSFAAYARRAAQAGAWD